MHKRAHALFAIKSVDTAKRIIEGFATTPSIDRSGDSMDPFGAKFTLPMPLKWKHGPTIGEVFEATPSDDGIFIRAKIATLDAGAPLSLKERINTAWHSIIAQPPLARALSIGWAGLDSTPITHGSKSATRWTSWIWGETSVVDIPMNTEATIVAVKSIDAADLAALGLDPADPETSAGAAATVIRYRHMSTQPKTFAEQITDLSNRRAANEARMVDIQQKAAAEGRSKDEKEIEEFTTLRTEITTMDRELIDLRDLDTMSKQKAQPIANPHAPTITAPPTSSIIRVKPNVPPGTAFTRMCMALGSAKGDSFQALERAKTWADTTPEVELMVKAAIAAGTTTDATWAGPLVAVKPLVDEFLELLRPRTLIGRIPGLRRVPFNVSVPSQTTGGTYGWVGQNKPKPVTKADYTTVTLTFAKAAGIIVLTEELVKLSSPSAEGLVREEMIAGMSQFLDVQFNDPAVAAVANVNPASITNGASTAAASGTTGAAARTDLAASVAVFTAAGIPLEGSVWLMSDSNAFGLAMSVNALGQPLFPGMSMDGGTLFGMPVVVSNNVSNRVILVHAPSILYADDGGVSIDVSRDASVQMDSAPTDTVDATTVYVSLWQRNLVGLKAERFITWLRARTAAVRYITAAAYAGT